MRSFKQALSRPRPAALVAVALVAVAAAAPASGQFRVADPELVFKGYTTDIQPGVHVVSDLATFRSMAAFIEPTPEDPSLDGTRLMVVVGETLDSDCRETILDEVGTRFRTARITLREERAGPTCRCTTRDPVRSVFGILVPGMIKKARLSTVDVDRDCGAAGRRPEGTTAAVEEILSGTLIEAEPGSRLITERSSWLALCADLNQSESCAAVDFGRSRVAVAVGAPLENSCRRTASDGITVESGAARVSLREIYPGSDRMCAQVFGGHQVYAYRVPSSVETVEIASRKLQ